MGAMDAGLDHERCYRAVASRDARFDGTFYTAVRTTGIYCRPSCPALTPGRANVTFFRTAAAAQRAGFRACRRCRPDVVPGSPEWNLRGDLVGRAMRLVADGAVERVGVAGVAAALGYSERHLNRLVTAELGVGLLAIARAQRAHTARTLLETTDLPAAEVAWAAGFGSVRAFNEAIATTYGEAPTAVRARRRRSAPGIAGRAVGASDPADPGGAHAAVTVRLATRAPLDAESLLAFLGQRAVAGVEAYDGATYRRSLGLPHGHGIVACGATPGGVSASFRLADPRDLAPAVARVRRLLDLDADPAAVLDVLGADPMLAPAVRARPGLRIPGCVDAHEVLVRAVAGQQVSVAGARTVVGRLVAAHGVRLALADPELTHVFPTPDALAGVDPTRLSMPRARGATLVGACAALADGRLVLDPGVDRDAARAALLDLPGIGPWTAGYVAMRGLGDPDVMLEADLGVRHAVEALGGEGTPRAIAARAHAWRPWRSYAVAHLWAGLGAPASTGSASDSAFRFRKNGSELQEGKRIRGGDRGGRVGGHERRAAEQLRASTSQAPRPDDRSPT
jgi:AraC family transcriptional regulator, regulatory protein of adaptative response / DNA-3-methyladenine glycosylase II